MVVEAPRFLVGEGGGGGGYPPPPNPHPPPSPPPPPSNTHFLFVTASQVLQYLHKSLNSAFCYVQICGAQVGALVH